MKWCIDRCSICDMLLTCAPAVYCFDSVWLCRNWKQKSTVSDIDVTWICVMVNLTSDYIWFMTSTFDREIFLEIKIVYNLKITSQILMLFSVSCTSRIKANICDLNIWPWQLKLMVAWRSVLPWHSLINYISVNHIQCTVNMSVWTSCWSTRLPYVYSSMG